MPSFKRSLPLLFCLTVGCVALAEDVPTLYVVGDSTAASYPPDRAPLTGWAQVLQDYFDPAKLKVDDRARSGRSSKSFIEEGAWKPIADALKPGDFVFIQFGHNDSKKDDPERFTDPESTYKQFLSTYIDETRAKGATPVLVTPIYRDRWEDGRIKDTHAGYPPAMRELAKDKQVTILDLHAKTAERFQQLGPDATRGLFMYLAKGESPNYPDGIQDGTHLRDTGAHEICRLAVQAIEASDLPLKAWVVKP